MDQIQSRYGETYDEFSSLLAHSVAVVEAQTGHMPAGDREFYAERIFSKMVCHGVSLESLSPSPQPTNTSELWDVSSVYAIARTLIETYEALFYIALEQVEDEERDFRTSLWKLHAEERRSEMLRLIGSNSPEVSTIDARMNALRATVLGHTFLERAGVDVSRKVQRGEAPPYHLSRADRDARAGIDREYHNAVIMHLSSHVHTYPFSVFQLMEFRAGEPECLRLMSIPLQYASGFLAKGLYGMIELFAPRVPPASPRLVRAVTKWMGLLGQGLKKVG